MTEIPPASLAAAAAKYAAAMTATTEAFAAGASRAQVDELARETYAAAHTYSMVASTVLSAGWTADRARWSAVADSALWNAVRIGGSK